MKVLLITGGTSNEASISRNSCTNIRKMLDNTKYDIDTVGIDESGVWYKLSDSINDYTVNNWLANASTISDLYSFIKLYDVVFPVLHGKNGEDGTIQGLLELINVPYVGCKVLSSALCMDKVTTKRVLESFNINVAPYLFVKKIKGKYYVETKEGELLQDFGELVEREIGYPCFVKASRSGSSVGCFKLKDKSSLKSTLDKVGEVDTRILIEKAIIGKELECGILGNNELIISEVGQIIPHGDFYSYQAKYFDSKSNTIVPADISYSVSADIKKLAGIAYRALDCSGLARCDFFLEDKTNTVYLNEVNTMPGFTSISMYPILMQNIGINASELIDSLIELALEK